MFTSRALGNLSSVSGTDRASAADAREALRASLGVERIARGRQVHGAEVARVTRADGRSSATLREADGQVTTLAGVALMVLAADCLPVAIGAEGAIGMLHAGWRGIAAGVLERGVLTLRELGCSEQIAAVIGPGAGACCYEVGPKVQAALGGPARRGPIDLAQLARSRLLACGVGDVRIVDTCTICDERYFSHRREGSAAGRQAGIAWRG
jgi:YfiH family protein